jgi:hypothetical protein
MELIFKKGGYKMFAFFRIKLGHRFSQIFTDIWFFVAFNILVIRVHPCPQNGNSYTLHLGKLFLVPLGARTYFKPHRSVQAQCRRLLAIGC